MDNKVSILITGDFYAGHRIENLIFEEKFSEIYNDFLPLIRESDIAVTNLESPLTDHNVPIEKTGPAIKASKKSIEALSYGGFNLVTLANNHIMDFGDRGLTDTLDLCNANKIDYVGAGMSNAEASRTLYLESKGKKLAFINFAENEWSNTHDARPGANPLNPVANFYAIAEARKNADFVFVVVHGGHEMYSLPSPKMKETYRFFVDAGASAVIGHHTHSYSGYELYNGSPIFYSLGNFIFDWPNKRNSTWNRGYAVKFSIDGSKLSFKIHPYEQGNDVVGVCRLGGEKLEEFQMHLSELNSIIQDDEELKRNFDNWCMKMSKSYNSHLEPYSNRYLQALQKRRLVPSFLTKKKRLLYCNLLRCESHRDVLLNLLSK